MSPTNQRHPDNVRRGLEQQLEFCRNAGLAAAGGAAALTAYASDHKSMISIVFIVCIGALVSSAVSSFGACIEAIRQIKETSPDDGLSNLWMTISQVGFGIAIMLFFPVNAALWYSR